MQLTENFSLEELTKCSRDIANIPNMFEIANLKELAENCLQPIRNKFGAVIVSSGFRNAEYNKIVGGVENSQHLKGEAADIQFSKSVSIDEVFEWVWRNLEFDQVILENKNGSRWIHISHKKTDNRKDAIIANFGKGKMEYKKWK